MCHFWCIFLYRPYSLDLRIGLDISLWPLTSLRAMDRVEEPLRSFVLIFVQWNAVRFRAKETFFKT